MAIGAVKDDEDPAFENAICLDDHCYDGCSNKDIAQVIASIASIAQPQWQVEKVTVIDFDCSDIDPDTSAFRGTYRGCVQVTLHLAETMPPFRIFTGKNFDWSLIFRLNERLPANVEERFAIFLDGSAGIVFLKPDGLQHLEQLCNYRFILREDDQAARINLASSTSL